MAIFVRVLRLKVMACKPSEQANMLMSMAYLDQILPVSSTVEAVHVTRRASMWSWFATNTIPTDIAITVFKKRLVAAYLYCMRISRVRASTCVRPRTYACVMLPTDVGSP